ncbi:hypothetical protein HMPREF9946_02237 [Acetobacteraceae bacterium AT-5844]|nr:hypothetical protein HMPREF9946_02237 [Acetobacteraceae bacterium AT-5844]
MRIFALALISLLSGCALTTDYVDVSYGEARTQQTVPGASVTVVHVDAVDGRTDRRDRVSSKKNGFGTEMAPIISTTDVVAETGRAITAELAAKGFRIGPDGARLRVEVIKFYSDFRTGFWAGDAVAEITLNVQVLTRSGQIAYSRVFTSQGLEPNIQLMLGHNAQAALNDALRKVVPQLVDDPGLIAALMAQGGAAPYPSIQPTS